MEVNTPQSSPEVISPRLWRRGSGALVVTFGQRWGGIWLIAVREELLLLPALSITFPFDWLDAIVGWHNEVLLRQNTVPEIWENTQWISARLIRFKFLDNWWRQTRTAILADHDNSVMSRLLRHLSSYFCCNYVLLLCALVDFIQQLIKVSLSIGSDVIWKGFWLIFLSV